MSQTAATALKRRRKRKQPIYFVCTKLVNPDTGELIGALVPANSVDYQLMRDRKVGVGKEVRAEITKPREVWFHRLGHKICGLLSNNVPDFQGMGAHEILKKIQLAAGICCTPMELDLGALGKHHINVPDSIAFDCMADGEFRQLIKAICDYIIEHYWPEMTQAEIEQMAEMYDPTSH